MHRAGSGRPSKDTRDLAKLYQRLQLEGLTPGQLAIGGETITAAATRIEKATSQDLRRLIQPWQARALTYYDMIGEVWFSSQFYSRTLAKVRLFPAVLDDNGDPQESDDPVLQKLWARVQDPSGGRSELQESYGKLMFLIGEGYLIVEPDPDWGEVWEFLSPDELRVQPGGIIVRYRAPQIGTEEYYTAPEGEFTPIEGVGTAPDQVVPWRLWRKHPRFSWWADGPVHATLDILEELLLLTLAVRSQAKSRAANSGILLWPDEMSLPQLDASGDEDPLNDPFFEEFAANYLAPINDPGSSSAGTPLFVRMAAAMIAESAGGPRFMKFDANDAYGEQGMRNELVKRYAMGVDLPPSQLLGSEDSNHWPCDETTEVFTQDRGFVTHDELNAGDIVLTLNHESGLSEWEPLKGVRREHVVDHEMVRVQTANLDALTTPGHRWPVIRDSDRIWTDGEHLRPGDRIIRAAAHHGLPTEKTYTDQFVELVGWFVTEGTCTWTSHKSCQMRIGQSHIANPRRVVEIRELLTAMHGSASATLLRGPGVPRGAYVPPAWREDREERGMTLFNLNKTAYAPVLDAMESWQSKVISRDFIMALTRSQLVILLETCAKGDGHLRAAGGMAINQRDPERLAPLALAAILLGRPVSFSERQQKDGFSEGTQHYLNIPVHGLDRPTGETTREMYTGVIFCPKVPVGRSFLSRRNGKVCFTGNTEWLVDEQSWKAHLLPATIRMCNDFGSSYLRPAAHEAGFKNWPKVVVGYDATEVINHPDQGKDYLDLYNARAIGKSALRIAKGASDADAPNEDELNEMIGIALRDGSFVKYGVPQIKGTGLEPEPGEIEETSGGQTTDAPTGPTTGADAEKGPPPLSNPDEEVPITASVDADRRERIIWAAEAAVDRCREIAGSRIITKVKNQRCGDCLTVIDGHDQTMFAAALGPERLADLKANPAQLVKDGARAFARTAGKYGLVNGYGPELAEVIEAHAAATLFEAEPSGLPAAFHQMLEAVSG